MMAHVCVVLLLPVDKQNSQLVVLERAILERERERNKYSTNNNVDERGVFIFYFFIF